jgi:hypothetical protein
MAELADAGLDDDELDIIQHEFEMDPKADQDESNDGEVLDSDDDDNHSVVTSSTVHDSHLPTASRPPVAQAPSKPTVPVKRKHGPRKKTSPEFIDEGDEGAGPGKPNYLSV